MERYLCDTCLYANNCQFIAKHKEGATGCSAYINTYGVSVDRIGEICEAERDGRLMILDKKPLPLVLKPGCTDAYCPYCDEDVSGLWGIADSVYDICQCPECGGYINVYAPAISPEEAEAALEKQEGAEHERD